MIVRRIMFSVLALVMAIALGVLGGSFLLADYIRRHGLFFPEPYPSGNWRPESFASPPEETAFRTDDGALLSGWLFRSAGNSPAPFVIWFHGNAGNITHRAPVAAEIARRGATVFLFDYRGFGKSEGTPTEDNVRLDGEAAWRHATSSLGADPNRVVLYGESLGGPYAAWVATRHRPCAVIIENSFPSLKKVARLIYPNLPLALVARDGLLTLRWLNAAGAPVLVMHGEGDTVLPVSLGRDLFQGLSVPKRLFISESADHGQIPNVEGSRYYDAIFSFLRENCAAHAEPGDSGS